MILSLKIFFCYFCLCLLVFTSTLAVNVFVSLFLLFCFTLVLSFLFFSLQLYYFMLIFLSVYVGAVLVLFVFVFMFLSSDTSFQIKFSNNIRVLLIFALILCSFFYLWMTFDYNVDAITLGRLDFVPFSEVEYFSIKLYIEFAFCLMYFGFIFFIVLIGVASLIQKND